MTRIDANEGFLEFHPNGNANASDIWFDDRGRVLLFSPLLLARDGHWLRETLDDRWRLSSTNDVTVIFRGSLERAFQYTAKTESHSSFLSRSTVDGEIVALAAIYSLYQFVTFFAMLVATRAIMPSRGAIQISRYSFRELFRGCFS